MEYTRVSKASVSATYPKVFCYSWAFVTGSGENLAVGVASGLPRNCSETRIADPEIATELLRRTKNQAGTSVEEKGQERWINCFAYSARVLLKFIT